MNTENTSIIATIFANFILACIYACYKKKNHRPQKSSESGGDPSPAETPKDVVELKKIEKQLERMSTVIEKIENKLDSGD